MVQEVFVVMHWRLSPCALTAKAKYHNEPPLVDQESVAELFPHDTDTFRLRGAHGAENREAHMLWLEKI